MAPPHDDEPRSSGLRRLDERVVPVLQRGARRVGRVLTAPFRGLAALDGKVGGGAFADWLWRHRQGFAFLTALLVFVGSYVHVQRYDLGGASEPVAVPGDGETASDADDPLPGATAAFVGPEEGEDLQAYIDEQRAELDDAEAESERVAVVSFASYLDAEQTADVLNGPTGVQLLLRVPAEEQDAFTVDVESGASVAQIVREEVDRIRQEVSTQEADIAELLESETVDDPEYKAFYEAEVERLAGIRNLLGSDGGIVYGAVVRDEVAALRELADTDVVRLVDLAPAEIDVASSTFEAVLPERPGQPGGEDDPVAGAGNDSGNASGNGAQAGSGSVAT